MRVLLIAPYCDGTDVGEAWSTFQWVSRLSKIVDVTALVWRKRGRPSIVNQLPDARVVEWDDLPFAGCFERFNSILKPGYIAFYRRARRWIRGSLLAGEKFDIAHQLSPLAIRYPSPVAGLGIPYIVGPLGGSLPTPSGFKSDFTRQPWYMRLRALDSIRFRYDPLLRKTLEGASAVIGVAPYVLELLRDMRIGRFEVMGETGVTEMPTWEPRDRQSGQTLRLLYVGRLVRSKGIRDAIRAMSYCGVRRHLTFDILGDGPDRLQCEAEISRLGLSERCRLHGRVSRSECSYYYSSSDLFVFPSFREPSGNVVYEALSWGLPVITTPHGGPGYLVDETCGRRVWADHPEQFARKIADSIIELADSPDLISQLSDGARVRMRTLALWSEKVIRMHELYQEIC